MERWQYQTVQIEAKGFMGGIIDLDAFQGELNQLGSEGWELVTCFDTSMNQGQSRYVIAVLKRKLD